MKRQPVPVRPLHRICRIALFGLVAFGGAASGSARQHWIKVESPDFIIYSDASEKSVADCAVDYTAFRLVLRQLFLPPDRALPPAVLILYRSPSTFRDMTNGAPERPDTERVNFQAEIDGTPYSTFALAGDRREALARTFEFETIWALRRLGYYVPVWMSQGAGEVLSELQLHKGKCLVGADDEHSSRSAFDWPHFFEIGETSKAYTDPDQLADYLAQAWGLMHWILLDDEATRERFSDIASRLATTRAIDAVATVMRTPPDQFSRAIRRHLARMHGPREIAFDPEAARARLHFSTPPEAEVLAETSNLLAASRQTARCNAQIDRALALAPDLPSVKDALARRMLREGRDEEALEFYRAAIAAGTKNFRAYIISATSRLNDVSSGGNDVAGEGGLPATVAASELREAIKLNPGSLEAYQQLGRAFFVMPAITDENVKELSGGVGPGRAGELVRFYRALLYDRLHRRDECRTDLQAVVSDPDTDDQLRRMATGRLARL